ncbi:MAG: arginase family protein [Gemmatimonadota bacterium]
MNVHLILVPYDSGHRDLRMGRGPSRLYEAGISSALEQTGAKVTVTTIDLPSDSFPAEVGAAFALNRLLASTVAEAKAAGALPIVLAGNCNTAIGTVTGLHATNGRIPAVCWLDAHADFNTPETSSSGFLDGMAVAILTGRAWRAMTQTVESFQPVPESRVVLVGTRDYDPIEEALLVSSPIRRVPVGELGVGFDEALDAIHAEAPTMYFHLDLDVVDISEGSANTFACAGGLSRTNVLDVFERATKKLELGALAITAYDPTNGPDLHIEALAFAVASAAVRK